MAQRAWGFEFKQIFTWLKTRPRRSLAEVGRRVLDFVPEAGLSAVERKRRAETLAEVLAAEIKITGTPTIGMGSWGRGATEFLLFGTTNQKMRLVDATREPNLFTAPRGKHSAKPAEAYELITRNSPGPRCSLFQRPPARGSSVGGTRSPRTPRCPLEQRQKEPHMSHKLPQDAGHGQKLTRKTEAAVAALLSSSSIVEAAKACGVAERTIRNWMTRPDFRDAYDQARRQVLDQVLAVCRDCDARPAARVAAARAVLDLSVKIRSEEDFDARLRALEAHKEQTRENGMTWADVMRRAEEP